MNHENSNGRISPSNDNVHPICKNSPAPEKCEALAERLDQVYAKLAINDGLAAQVQAETGGKDK